MSKILLIGGFILIFRQTITITYPSGEEIVHQLRDIGYCMVSIGWLFLIKETAVKVLNKHREGN